MRQQHDILVNTDRCIGCGLCVKDCVAGALTLKNGKARGGNGGCISCGHCEAICPKKAIALTGFQDIPVEFEEQTRLDPDTLLMAAKSRRTVRSFTEEPVSEKDLNMILEAGRYAPTGSNSQDTSYIVLGSRQAEAEELAVSMFRMLAGPASKLVSFLKNMNIDDNFFFKKAPLVIVLTGSSVNASLAAENMAFMAEALGLGVLFSGFFTVCANKNHKIKTLLGLETGEKAITTLVIGHPAVKYHRTARREEAKVRIL